MLSVNNMLNTNYKRPAVLDISNLLNTAYEPYQKSPSLSPSLTSSPANKHKESDDDELADTDEESPIKAKRRRANAKQLEVLNRVFDRTFFPSTQMRAELGRQLGMSPRTVQIWFQNRRQAMRTRER
ncbi:Homeodomain-like protein, partial [Blakeslea trispora]